MLHMEVFVLIRDAALTLDALNSLGKLRDCPGAPYSCSGFLCCREASEIVGKLLAERAKAKGVEGVALQLQKGQSYHMLR